MKQILEEIRKMSSKLLVRYWASAESRNQVFSVCVRSSIFMVSPSCLPRCPFL